MSGKQAKITSLDEMKDFHQQLIIYSEEMLSALTRLRSENSKRVNFIENEWPDRLRGEKKHWLEQLSQAKNSLNARTAAGRQAAEQQATLAAGKIKALDERLQIISKWQKKLPALLPEPEARLLKLKTFILNDMDKAITLLKNHIDSIDDYRDIQQGSQ